MTWWWKCKERPSREVPGSSKGDTFVKSNEKEVEELGIQTWVQKAFRNVLRRDEPQRPFK